MFQFLYRRVGFLSDISSKILSYHSVTPSRPSRFHISFASVYINPQERGGKWKGEQKKINQNNIINYKIIIIITIIIIIIMNEMKEPIELS